jgi:hypothetical protein
MKTIQQTVDRDYLELAAQVGAEEAFLVHDGTARITIPVEHNKLIR